MGKVRRLLLYLKGRRNSRPEGQAEDLHIAWKVGTNLLEYCSGIATRTNELVQAAKSIDPRIEIVTTRKIFPGTKELSIMAAIDGGALPHRLGLSETVLIFSQHRAFVGGIDGLLKKLDEIKARAFEKKIMVEVSCLEDAVKLARAGVDGLQFDKIPLLPKVQSAYSLTKPISLG